MLNFEDIQRYFWGSWRIMNGHADGLEFFDLSEDGFWQSFHAITVSLPPLILSWIVFANDVVAFRPETGTRLSLIGRIAFVDLTAWVLPLAVLLFVAPRIGLRSRFSVYVITSNWGSALVNWLVVPATLIHIFMPTRPQFSLGVDLVLNAVALVLTYRLTHVALKKTYAYTTAFFAILVTGYIILVVVLQSVLGIAMPEPITLG
ncbi:hypothetical protein [Phyllobacterium myrsinacearum]|uniref:Transporter n=1 Tax=Phyllobacterium myrsinacearum TaxID=28101 RepID=A0A2S9JA24_9HYPH|nr:hypothetical protein [Phyllobacterium myrsinacearum]PRD49609.1 hypothetical protein C5750_24600 [Phyllobacterium myrsinacearum]PWV94811.1 hypothetical protein DEV92_102265 [Phyllobacterium myrsinacearum]RZS87883.1 hypothetical protein EV217_0260 [Phyllobacterium myrsinacearum]RZV07078.1 hypothetical protein EV654_1746 [Phyllobacterium myrsinacearum]